MPPRRRCADADYFRAALLMMPLSPLSLFFSYARHFAADYYDATRRC